MTQTPLRGIRKLTVVNESLASSGQPTENQFDSIRDAGFDVVINLLPGGSPCGLADEPDVVRDLGMDYFHIPVIWSEPTVRDVAHFFHLMDTQTGRRVFVHCAANMRASAFVYLYRVCRLGHDPEDAVVELNDIWEPEGCWANLMDTVRADPPPRISPEKCGPAGNGIARKTGKM